MHLLEYSFFSGWVFWNRDENERFHIWFVPSIFIWTAMVLKERHKKSTQTHTICLCERTRDFYFLLVAPIYLVVLNLIPSFLSLFIFLHRIWFNFYFLFLYDIHSTTESSNGNITNGKTSVNIIWLMKKSKSAKSARSDFYR